MTEISVFDVDRTLTIRPTYSAFLIFAIMRLAPWRLLLLPVLITVALAYVLKLVPRRKMKEVMHRLALGQRIDRQRIEPVAAAFVERLAAGGVYPQAHALVAADRADGRRLMLATAAQALYIAPLAERLAIADVVASHGRWDGEVLCSDILDENCYGPAKRRMLDAWLASSGIARDEANIRFYSDHASDLPTFEWADEAVAVNPSPELRVIAAQRGWQVLDWRKA